MVLMAAGSELDPVYDALAPVVALTHAGQLNWATMTKCIRVAQQEQQRNARFLGRRQGAFR